MQNKKCSLSLFYYFNYDEFPAHLTFCDIFAQPPIKLSLTLSHRLLIVHHHYIPDVAMHVIQTCEQ